MMSVERYTLQTILQSIDKFVSIENKQIIVDHRTQISVQSTPFRNNTAGFPDVLMDMCVCGVYLPRKYRAKRSPKDRRNLDAITTSANV